MRKGVWSARLQPLVFSGLSGQSGRFTTIGVEVLLTTTHSKGSVSDGLISMCGNPKFQGKRFRQYLTAVDELKRFAHERFGKSVLALAVRWVLDQGPNIALWGARNPRQLDPIGDVDGWHIDPATKAEIDAILKRCIVNPVSPSFMAPPVTSFRREDANPTRVRGQRMIIELHGAGHFKRQRVSHREGRERI
jgi:hypothetical protein